MAQEEGPDRIISTENLTNCARDGCVKLRMIPEFPGNRDSMSLITFTKKQCQVTIRHSKSYVFYIFPFKSSSTNLQVGRYFWIGFHRMPEIGMQWRSRERASWSSGAIPSTWRTSRPWPRPSSIWDSNIITELPFGASILQNGSSQTWHQSSQVAL